MTTRAPEAERIAAKLAIGREVVRKVRARIEWRLRRPERARAGAWAERRAVEVAGWAAAIDPVAWDEADRHADSVRQRAAEVLPGVPVRLGGGGDHRLLHFLVRVLQPAVVVETGVAAGWSSHAILSALEANGAGRLHSSDLPYLSRPGSAQYVGVLVPPELRRRWDLHLDGDRANLPRILSSCGPVDLFHYDSAKARSQRQATWRLVEPHLCAGATVVFDDVQDDAHFAEMVSGGAPHLVFGFAGKYLGVLGPLAERRPA